MTTPFGRILTLLRPPVREVPRAALMRVQHRLPALSTNAARAAIRLHLLPQMPAGKPFAFVWRIEGDLHTIWAWAVPSDDPGIAAAWPEPLLDPQGAGSRLLQRADGFEGQVWRSEQLIHSRWWSTEPGDVEWATFVRGCGLDLEQTPRPEPEVPQRLTEPPRGWLRGDTLPPTRQRALWLKRLGVLLPVGLLAAALGWNWQTRILLADLLEEQKRLSADRQSSSQARNRYQQLLQEHNKLLALAPTSSQLMLISELLASGVFDPKPSTARSGASAAGSLNQTILANNAPEAPAPANVLTDWEFRSGQLKLTIEMAGDQQAMLDLTRRLEQLPSFHDLRIGLESSGSSLTLNLRVREPAPTRGAGS